MKTKTQFPKHIIRSIQGFVFLGQLLPSRSNRAALPPTNFLLISALQLVSGNMDGQHRNYPNDGLSAF